MSVNLLQPVAAGARRIGESLEHAGDAARRGRVRQLIDPFDLAGHVSRSVSGSHPTPQAAHAVYYVVLGGLALTEVIEPPVALLLGVGHLLLHSHNQYLEELGEAVDEAG
jgi:hypothetical protein